MRNRWRGPAGLVTGAGVLLGCLACTDGSPGDTDTPDPTPTALPTAFLGEPPPGLAPEPVRTLVPPDGTTHDVLDDPMGVRVQSVGDAFLVSSDSTEQHLLQDATDGETLWEGTDRVERFTRDRDGEPAFTVVSTDDPATVTVVNHLGEELWQGDNPRDRFVDGWVLRRPDGWTASEPYGEYRIRDIDGEEAWSWELTAPDNDDDETDDDEDPEDAPDDDTDDADAVGTPVGVAADVLLLNDRAGTLHARDLADDGAPLWTVSGDDEDMPDNDAITRPTPQLVGVYGVPEDIDGAEDNADEDADDTGAGDTDDPDGDTDSTDDEDAADPTALVRWAYPDTPSVLSLVDLATGDIRWTLTEPGANPADDAAPETHAPGTVHNPDTGILLLQQTSGTVPAIAVELATGTVAWELDPEDDVEASIVPAFAVGPYIYGTSRGAGEGSTQVVLDAADKDLVADRLDAHVESVTDDGHAIVVRDRQRYVFPVTPDVED